MDENLGCERLTCDAPATTWLDDGDSGLGYCDEHARCQVEGCDELAWYVVHSAPDATSWRKACPKHDTAHCRGDTLRWACPHLRSADVDMCARCRRAHVLADAIA